MPHRIRARGLFLIFIGALVFVPKLAVAQNIKGAIRGEVIDAQGRAVPEAQIAITDPQRGTERRLRSDSQGSFYQPGLDAGNYRVQVSKPGFEPHTSTSLELRVGDVANLEIKLQLEGIKTQVDVTAQAPSLLVVDPRQSKSFTRQEMNDLPVEAGAQGRNFYAQALTAPGVAVSLLAHRPFAISGQRPRNNNYMVDSVELNDADTGFIAGRASTEELVSQEAVQSFEIITHNAKAEYGRNSGGVVNLVTKSGSNQLHGSLYEYHDTSALSARNPFETTKTPNHSNLAGGTVGGPIRKNKAFFFGNYELFRPRGSTVGTYQTLTDDERARALPAVIPLVSLYPRSPQGARVVTQGIPIHNDQYSWLVRGDVFVTDRQSLMARANSVDSQNETDGGGNVVGNRVRIHNTTKSLALHHGYVFGPTLLNELRFGASRQIEEDAFLTSPLIGDPAVNGPIGFLIVPGLNLGGPLPYLGRHNFQNNFQVSDDISWTRGRHNFKFGSSLRRVQINGGAITNTFRGQIFFPTISAFLAGQPLSYSINVGNPLIGLRRTEWHGYLQDDWRVTPTLTLNLGLRYELNTVPTEEAGRIPEAFRFHADHKDFAPRVGFAWSVRPKTVLRGGYGIFYNALEMDFVGLTRFNPPLIQSLSAFRPTVPNQLQAKSGIPNGLVLPDPNARTPYAQDLTFAVERQLWNPQSTLTLAYVGTLGAKLPRARRPNGGENLPQSQRPDPTIGVLNRLETTALSNYHALQVKFTQRLGTHFDLRAAYTWSRFIDDVSDIPGRNQGLDRNLVPMDDNNLRRDRAVSDFDISHVFSLSYLYRVPFLPRNRWVGGWSISGITTLQSGRPLTLYSGTDTPTGTNNNRINDIAGTLIRQPSTNLPIQLLPGATRQQLTPAPGTFGSLGRNTERGDSLLNWNLSLIKDIRVTESSYFQNPR